MQTTFQHPWYTAQQQLASTTTCESQSQQKPQWETLGQRRTDLDKNTTGDIAELYVSVIALWKGAKLHRNVSCVGDTDMVLQIDGQYIPIDVKLAAWKNAGKGSYRWNASDSHKVKLPVYPVIVVPKGEPSEWEVRWKNMPHSTKPHCPPGLENFWD